MVKDSRTGSTVDAASWRNPPGLGNLAYPPTLRGVIATSHAQDNCAGFTSA
jgi:hypothetical protein